MNSYSESNLGPLHCYNWFNRTRGKKRADGKMNEDGQQAKDTDSLPLTGRSTDVLSSCAEGL